MRVTALLLVASVAAACGGTTDAPPPGSAGASPVEARAVTVAVQPLPSTFEAGGTVQARTTALVSARTIAPIVAVLVSPGDRVHAGQALVRLDGRDLEAGRAAAEASSVALERGVDAARAELEAATAAHSLAAATHGRIATLAARKSATAQELDEAAAALTAASARQRGTDMRLAQAASALTAAREQARAASVTAGFATVVAPFDGVVTEKLVEPGNLASPGLPLLRVEDTRGSRLEVRVDASRTSLVVPGAPADILVDGVPEPLRGRVAEVSRAVTPGAQSFLVKIDLPTGATVRSGTFARAIFDGPARQAIAIPTGALVARGQLTTTYVVDGDGRARMRLVRTGAVAGGLVEVVSGLDAGERVLVEPPPTVVDGTSIRIAAPAAPADPAAARVR